MPSLDPPIRVPAGLAARLALTVALAVAGSWATHAWAGVNREALDARFGSGGFSTVSVGTWSAAAATVVQPNGAVITAGEAIVDGEDVILATRMGSNGTLDPTFGSTVSSPSASAPPPASTAAPGCSSSPTAIC